MQNNDLTRMSNEEILNAMQQILASPYQNWLSLPGTKTKRQVFSAA